MAYLLPTSLVRRIHHSTAGHKLEFLISLLELYTDVEETIDSAIKKKEEITTETIGITKKKPEN